MHVHANSSTTINNLSCDNRSAINHVDRPAVNKLGRVWRQSITPNTAGYRSLIVSANAVIDPRRCRFPDSLIKQVSHIHPAVR